MKNLFVAILFQASWLLSCAQRPPFPDSFDTAACRTRNTIKLPSGANMDNYDKFCSCEAQKADMNKLINTGAMDVDIPMCNPDGSWSCVQRSVMMMPRVRCLNQRGKQNKITDAVPDRFGGTEGCKKGGYCQNACMNYSTSADLSTGKWKNVGNCPCTIAADQELNPDVPEDQKYVPQCNPDKSWKKEQSGYGGNWCVDDMGSQVGPATYAALGQKAAACP